MPHITLSTIELVARAIEKKAPGTCGDIANTIHNMRHSTAYKKFQADQLKNTIQKKWNEYKDRFTADETVELSKSSGFDLSDPTQWESHLQLTNSEIVENTADIISSEIPINTDDNGGILESILDLLFG